MDYEREIRELTDDKKIEFYLDKEARARERGLQPTLVKNLHRAVLDQIGPNIIGKITLDTSKYTVENVIINVPVTLEEFIRAGPGKDYTLRKRNLALQKEAVRVGVEHGCEFFGAGAFNSISTDGARLLASETGQPFTSGAGGTVDGVVIGINAGCRLGNIDQRKSTVAIIGGAGAIAVQAAQELCKKFARVILVGRNLNRIESLKDHLVSDIGANPKRIVTMLSEDINEAMAQSDVVLLATNVGSASELRIMVSHVQPGTFFIDVGRPRNFSEQILQVPGIVVIEGAVFRIPGFCCPSATAALNMGNNRNVFGCLFETLLWGLEGETESKNLGFRSDPAVFRRIQRGRRKWGFEFDGFRWRERKVRNLDFQAMAEARSVRTQKQYLFVPAPLVKN
jgi:predicted amino acid dehydrogenase